MTSTAIASSTAATTSRPWSPSQRTHPLVSAGPVMNPTEPPTANTLIPAPLRPAEALLAKRIASGW